MRSVLLLAAALVAACVSDKLQVVPPTGVDFSGIWKLNEADSDDPQRLLQAQFNASTAEPSASGRRGGGALGGPAGPAMPSVGTLDDGLRWPGKLLEIKQVGGVVAFTSDGINRVCQPLGADRNRHHGASRDSPATGRDGPPPRCGWEESTLIVQGGDPDDDQPPFEERYSISQDRQRLVEVVGFKGGRSNGFTMSRVWDRAGRGCAHADDLQKCDQQTGLR